jgi:hypothetical protein
MKTIVDFRLGDVVQLRKPHPCGSYTWTVVRLGADIGLVCLTCSRRILLPRSTLERRMKKFLERGAVPSDVDEAGPDRMDKIDEPS